MRGAPWFGRAASGVVIAAVVLTTAALAAPGATERVAKEGGTFRIAVTSNALTTTIDPAFGVSLLLDPACETLMGYPDKGPPQGLTLAPGLAETEPVVSRNGRTYTFTLRRDARFSTGARVTADSFVRAFERILTPAMHSPVVGALADIVGAREMLSGKATRLSGAVARGRVLTVRLTKRVADLLDRTAGLCAVPPSLPAQPEGAKAPLPSAAPYYVAEYVPGERLVLERNRFYRGERPHHVDRFVADLAVPQGSAVDLVASGAFDTVVPLGALFERSSELAGRYGVNRSQFWVAPGFGFRVFHLNTSRALFRNNVKLRQAVNLAVDRRAIAREAGVLAERPTDQYLLPGTPGYRDARIYPLKGPDLRRASALAEGRTRGGKAVLYTLNNPTDVAQAQILQRNLRAIGLELEIVLFPSGTLLFEKLQTERHLYDIGRVRWFVSPDPAFLHLFDGRTIDRPGNQNYSYFDSPRYNRLLEQASRLTGQKRYRAYGELDVQLSRDAAPAIPISRVNALAFVSPRVGCVVMNPALDLTAVCLK